jgi:hypothetical protein
MVILLDVRVESWVRTPTVHTTTFKNTDYNYCWFIILMDNSYYDLMKYNQFRNETINRIYDAIGMKITSILFYNV